MSSCSRSEKELYEAAVGSLKSCSLEDNKKMKKLAEKGEKIVMNEIPGIKDLFGALKRKMDGALKSKQKMDGGRRKTKKRNKRNKRTRKQKGGVNQLFRRIFAHAIALSVFCIFFSMVYFGWDKVQSVIVYFATKYDNFFSDFIKQYTRCSTSEITAPYRNGFFWTIGSGILCAAATAGGAAVSGYSVGTATPAVVSSVLAACGGVGSYVGEEKKMEMTAASQCNLRRDNHMMLMNAIITLALSGGLFTLYAFLFRKVRGGTMSMTKLTTTIYNYIFDSIFYSEYSFDLFDLIRRGSLRLPPGELTELRGLHNEAMARRQIGVTIKMLNDMSHQYFINNRRVALLGDGIRMVNPFTPLPTNATMVEINQRLNQIPTDFRTHYMETRNYSQENRDSMAILINTVVTAIQASARATNERQLNLQDRAENFQNNLTRALTSLNTGLRDAGQQYSAAEEERRVNRDQILWEADNPGERYPGIEIRDRRRAAAKIREERNLQEQQSDHQKTEGGGKKRRRSRKRRKRSKTRRRSRKKRRRSRKR